MSGGASLGRRRVLVVEDNAVTALEIAVAVAALGCTVLGPAGSVAEARRLLDRGWPAAALLNRFGSHSPPLAASNARVSEPDV